MAASDERTPARLFTTDGIETKTDARRRAANALMATVSLVPSFSSRLLKALGVRTDARTETDTFVDVRVGAGSRPPVADALIEVRRGRSTVQVALVVRVGDDRIPAATVKKLRDAAASAGVDAVVTVSNEATGPDLGRSRSPVPVQHWPWGNVLATAVDEKVRDPEQAHVLGDLVAFLGHPDARVVSFGDMGPAWAEVLKTARTSRLSKRNAGVIDVCRRWDQVVRHIGVQLGTRAGRDVQHVVSSAEARDGDVRLRGLVDRAVDTGQLEGVYRVDGAAGDLAVVADLVGRRVVTVVVVKPPEGLGERATAGWLLDSLAGARGDAVVEAWSSRGREPMAAATLADLDADPGVLTDSRGRGGASFRVLLADEMATARTGSAKAKGFVESVAAMVEETWHTVLGPLSGEEAPKAPRGSRSTRSPRASTTVTAPRTPSTKRSSPPSSASSGRSTRASSGTKASSGRTSSSATRKRRTAAELARELRAER